MDKRGAYSEQAEIESPEILEGRADVPERVAAHKRAVSESGSVEGNNKAADGSDHLFIVIHGE